MQEQKIKFVDSVISPKKSQAINQPVASSIQPTASLSETSGFVDNKRRTFLKALGVAGLGAVGSMLLPRKASAYVFGSTPASNVVGIKDANNTRMTPAQETGGNLAQIQANTAPMLAGGGGVYVQQDSTGSIAKETGNLQTIANNIPTIGQKPMSGSMPVTIAYDQSALPISASFSGALGLKDTTSTQINPATDDSVTYLRRMVKQVDSLAVVDSAQRQKVTIDSITTALTLTTVTTVGTVTTVTNAVPVGNIATFSGVDARYLYIDTARNAFANGIRQNLAFS